MKVKNRFTFVPASLLANYSEKMITFCGTSYYFFTFRESIYFICDGCHVATKYKDNVSFNESHKFPSKVKKFINSIFLLSDGAFLTIGKIKTNSNYSKTLHIFSEKFTLISGTIVNENFTINDCINYAENNLSHTPNNDLSF